MSIRLVFIVTCGAVSLMTALVVSGLCLFIGNLDIHHLNTVLPELTALVMCLTLVSVWVGYLLVQPLRRRLYDIEEAASLIAAGRLHHRVETMGDTDEIGQLAAQFNVMGDKIEEQVGLLQRLAEQNRTLHAQAERAAALDERHRLARDLHDTVSQQLFAITMLAATAQRLYQNQSPALEKTLAQLNELSTSSQREMRALLLHLRPVELDGRSFEAAAADFLQAVTERHHLHCELSVHVDVRLTQSVEDHLFRILQEAIANVLKHAQATTVRVELTADVGQMVTLTVLDDGLGIRDEMLDGTHTSYGVRAMKERAASLGGRCTVWKRDRGTAVEVRIPLVEGIE